MFMYRYLKAMKLHHELFPMNLVRTLAPFVIVLWSFPAVAQDSRPQDLLVRNVTLIDPAGNADDRRVTILIRDGVLEVITEDRVPRGQAQLAVDGDGGFVLGRLELGAAPNFMILDADPRESFEVLLDTSTHASFAMHDGRVVRNKLADIADHDPGQEPPRTSWLAYTPPPLMVPLSYRDAGKWNRFDSEYISGIFIAGLVIDRMNWLHQDSVSQRQVGSLDEFEGGEIRGLRFGVAGTLNWFEKPWIYTIFGATNAFDDGFNEENLDDFGWFDWRLDVPFIGDSVLSIGKQKEPISGERAQSMLFNHMQERSAVADAMLPSRNVGVVWNGNSSERYMTWAVGAFNDWLEADEDFSDSASQYIGRFTWAPLRSADESNLLHAGAGYRYSNARGGFRYRTEPEFNQSSLFVDTGFGTETGVLPADSLSTWNAELSWRRGPLWLASEYTRTDVDSPTLGDPVFDGYWLAASWVLTGEMRGYNRKSGTFGGVPVSRSVYHNGKGAWEASARWSAVDLEDGPVEGGEMEIASLGLTWWATPFFGINVNYRYIWNTLDGVEGTSSGLNTRVMLLLE
jgi:phosphate-selective porin OprO/OprP